MTEIDIPGVCERDLDLLLLEEFVASRPFFEWFMNQIGIPASAQLRRAARSTSTSSGESDLDLTLDCGTHLVRVLIENKIDATLQPRQAQRYTERARQYIRSGECDACVTVIIAPNEYFPDDSDTLGFDRRISYEALLRWFDSASQLGPRGRYKQVLLQHALDRGRRGWQLVPDEVTTAFWRRYWELANSLAPQLQMPAPSEKPATSAFIRFKPAALPPTVELLHKVPHGNVDLQFSGMADRLAELHRQFGGQLRHGMRIERAFKSAVVRISVPRVDVRAPFLESEPALREALAAAADLLDWYEHVTEASGRLASR
ncbi:MAG TPA: PD-(D/E)XK nuclease family protein [Gemmatimonadales bacterium]|nr:PD-(D/E)XK nuclease family protein [Gemmatimonadales bacterium]